jgi:hypothetical protein
MQDDCVSANQAEMATEYAWLDRAVTMLTEMQIFLNHDRVGDIREETQRVDPDKFLAETVVINLLNDAQGGIIDATRLLLFGAHPDSYALTRSAFEACAYAEYFAHHPETVSSYMELEALILKNPPVNLRNELASRGLQVGTVMSRLNAADGEDRSGFYATLCNYGGHPSPMRVGLRMSAPNGAVLAAASRSTPDWSRAQWTHNGAISLIHVAHYAMEIAFEKFGDWFVSDSSWQTRREALSHGFLQLTQKAA